MEYTKLLSEADDNSLIVREKPLRAYDGRIKGKRVAIRRNMLDIQKKCVLAEELGHYYTTSGNILDQTDASNRKQEYRARLWAYNKLVGLQGIISANQSGCKNLFETADYLGVTEEFLREAIQCYHNKYGQYTVCDNYIIYFEPSIAVLEFI